MRPLTIPNFEDRIIQQTIRVILNAIYEPVFSTLSCSFGFRPHKSAIEAILHIQKTAYQKGNIAIKGDIQKAFDTVDPTTMIHILFNTFQKNQ